MILTYVIPPAVFVVGAISLNFLLIAIGGVVRAIMILCYAPTLRLYTRRPLEAPFTHSGTDVYPYDNRFCSALLAP